MKTLRLTITFDKIKGTREDMQKLSDYILDCVNANNTSMALFQDSVVEMQTDELGIAFSDSMEHGDLLNQYSVLEAVDEDNTEMSLGILEDALQIALYTMENEKDYFEELEEEQELSEAKSLIDYFIEAGIGRFYG
jgi:hypothetical protein